MKKTLIWILIAANVSLGGTLVWRGTENTANAQVTKQLSRGKYTLIPGEASSSSAIIYVFDSANERVGAVAPDNRDTLVAMPTIALRELFDKANEQPAPGNNPRPGNNNKPGNRPAR